MINSLKILLTGGSGFIGKNVLEQLGDKYLFLAPSSKELDLLDDFAVWGFLEKNNVDVVIHAANFATTRKTQGSSEILKKNLKMFFNLVRAKNFYKKMIVLGSGAEYSKQHNIKNIKESDFDINIPCDEYGFSKYIMAKYAQNVDFITHLRIFAVFGKYEDYVTRFISNNICRALLGENLSINKNTVFDYLYINDFIKILDFFISNNTKEKFCNIGSGAPISLLDLAELIRNKINKDLKIIVKNKEAGNEYTCNNSLLRKENNNVKFTEMSAALDDLIFYYRDIIFKLDKNSIFFD